jgi:hypothetical protein
VCGNDKNNDDILRFPIGKIGLCFHKMIDTVRYLTEGPKDVLSQTERKVRCTGNSSDKKSLGKLPPAFSTQSQNNFCIFARRTTVWKANIVIETNSQSSDLVKLIISLTVPLRLWRSF